MRISTLTGFMVMTAIAFALSAAAPVANAQTSSSASVKIKQRVQAMGIGENVTVRLQSGRRYYGTITDVADDVFSIAEVDLKQTMSIHYSDVRNVDKGYGRKSVFTGKRGVNPNNHWVKVVIIGALVAVPLIIVASVKN